MHARQQTLREHRAERETAHVRRQHGGDRELGGAEHDARTGASRQFDRRAPRSRSGRSRRTVRGRTERSRGVSTVGSVIDSWGVCGHGRAVYDPELLMAGFRANGLITLTTDFGLREPFVGIMKGVMLGARRRAAFHRHGSRDQRLSAGRGRVLAGARVALLSRRHAARRRGRSGRRHVARYRRRRVGRPGAAGARQRAVGARSRRAARSIASIRVDSTRARAVRRQRRRAPRSMAATCSRRWPRRIASGRCEPARSREPEVASSTRLDGKTRAARPTGVSKAWSSPSTTSAT